MATGTGRLGSIHDMLQCPYVRSHMVGASKFQTHLIKCRKANPDVAEDIAICVYNQAHHVRAKDMSMHLLLCRDAQYQQMYGLASTVRMIDNRRAWVETSDEPFESSTLQSQYLDEPKPMKKEKLPKPMKKEKFNRSQQFNESELNSTRNFDESEYTSQDETEDGDTSSEGTLDEALGLNMSMLSPDISAIGSGSMDSSFNESFEEADLMRNLEGPVNINPCSSAGPPRLEWYWEGEETE